MGTKQNVYGQMCLVITKHIFGWGKWAVRKEKKRKENNYCLHLGPKANLLSLQGILHVANLPGIIN